MYPQRNWFEIKRNEKREHEEIHENKRKEKTTKYDAQHIPLHS